MSDPRMSNDEEELLRCWQESAIGATDPAQLARDLAASVSRFDRKILWRNLREYLAGVAVLVWSGYEALHGSTSGILMMIGVSFMMGYLWWKHRGLQAIDPATNARSYHAAMLKRLDDQIQLLSRVRYWYLLPLYLPVLWMAVGLWSRSPWGASMVLAVVTSVFVFIGWLNEGLAVRHLKEVRGRVEAILDEGES